jgi:hypothetical protein
MYEYGKGTDENYTQAVYWYKKAAEQGDTEAQLNLAVMYKYGTGVNEDSSQAVFWYKKAAEQGNTKAQLNLAVMYASGEGILENFVLAYKWANLAGARGNENAREMKNEVKKRMTRTQIAEAQQLSLEWQQNQSGAEN